MSRRSAVVSILYENESVMDLSFTSPPKLVERVERSAWVDMFASASDEVRSTFSLESSAFGSVPLLGSRGLAITEFNRAFVLEDVDRPSMDALISWLEGNAAPQWALQIADSIHTSDIRSSAESLKLAPAGPGWSKLLAQAGSVPALSDMDDIAIVEGNGKDFGDIIAGVYGLPGVGADWFSSLAQRPGWSLCVASSNGSIAGAGAIYVEGDWAWFGIDATLPVFRGKGIQTALIRYRAERAKVRGARYLTAETGRPETAGGKHTSRDNYLRCGFSEAYHRLNYSPVSL